MATRQPPSLQVYDTASGARVAEIPLCDDAERHRVYAVCGEKAVDVMGHVDTDHYKRLQRVPTSSGAAHGTVRRCT